MMNDKNLRVCTEEEYIKFQKLGFNSYKPDRLKQLVGIISDFSVGLIITGDGTTFVIRSYSAHAYLEFDHYAEENIKIIDCCMILAPHYNVFTTFKLKDPNKRVTDFMDENKSL